MFACMHVCLLVAYLLQKVWTDLANLFFVSSILVMYGFKPKNSGSEIPFF